MLTSVSDRCGEKEQNHLWLAQRRHHFPQVAAHGDNDNDKHHFIISFIQRHFSHETVVQAIKIRQIAKISLHIPGIPSTHFSDSDE